MSISGTSNYMSNTDILAWMEDEDGRPIRPTCATR